MTPCVRTSRAAEKRSVHDERHHNPTDAIHALDGCALKGDGFLDGAAHVSGFRAGELEVFALTGEGFRLAVAHVGEQLHDFIFAGHGVVLGGRGAGLLRTNQARNLSPRLIQHLCIVDDLAAHQCQDAGQCR